MKRFWDKVNKDAPNGCWEWTGYIRKDGYAKIDVGGKCIPAHRYSWVLANGEIPFHDSYHGMCVLHKCDNRKCVNPDHLTLGTQRDNNNDRDKKGRQASTKSWSSGHLITYNGETLPLYKWAKKVGISRQTLRYRIHISGWSVEDALTNPVMYK